MSPLDLLTALVVVVVWGLNFAAVKVALTEFSPLLLTSLRFAFVAVCLLPWLRAPKERWGQLLLLSSVMGVGHFGLMFLGMDGVDAAAAAIIIQLGVPFSSLLAALVYKDHLGWRRGLALALAFAGVAILAGEPHLTHLTGLVAVVGAALGWAVGNLVAKTLHDLPALTVNAFLGLLAAPQLLALSLVFEDGQAKAIVDATWKGWGALAFIVLMSSLVAYTLWYRLVARYDLNQVVPITMLGPVIGGLSGILLLDEPATWHKIVGGALTLVGVAIIHLRQKRKTGHDPVPIGEL